jgi:hypothetical protein
LEGPSITYYSIARALASGNQVAIDVEGVKTLQGFAGNSLEGRNSWNLVQIEHAVRLGLGPDNEHEYEVVVSWH